MKYNFEVECSLLGHRLNVAVRGASFIMKEGKVDLFSYRPAMNEKGYRPMIIPQSDNCMAYLFNGQGERVATHVYNLPTNGLGAVFCAAFDAEAAEGMLDEFLQSTNAELSELDEATLAVLKATEQDFLALGDDQPRTTRRFG